MSKVRKSLYALIILSLLAVSIVVVYTLYYPNNRVVEAFSENGTNLVVGDRVDTSANRPVVENDEIMLPVESIRNYFDPAIWWDQGVGKVTITTRDRVIRMQTDNLTAYVNNKPVNLNIPVKLEGDIPYIPIEFLSDLYGIEVKYLKSSNVVVIDFKSSTLQTAEPVSPKAAVRTGRSIRKPIVSKPDMNSPNPEDKIMRVFGEYEKWYKVRTSDGKIGYIEKRYVKTNTVTVPETPKPEPSPAWKPEKGKVNLVWEYFENRYDYSKIEKMDGLDVLSPTWFELPGEPGKTLISHGDAKYVEWAHNSGYRVWPLFKNDFGSAEKTRQFLNNTDFRDSAIREILAYAALYKFDGINIDFENINKSDKDALTQFVRELTPFLKEQGLVISIDVGVPDGSDNWSLCYDRKSLGEVVDYMAVMTYDQHWATSPKAGSVAQITWVEKYLKKMLEEVPKEKLLLGLPFYTRVWKEETLENGSVKVTNPEVLTMDNARKRVRENNAEVRWEEGSGQFYTEYMKDNFKYRIWLEDENSIDLKSSLALKYEIAGVASWDRRSESKTIWGVLNKNLKTLDSYSAWLEQNKDKQRSYNTN